MEGQKSHIECLFCLRVKGLPTKKKYLFRVLAENLAGPGKPSVETDPVLIKDPIGTLNATLNWSSVIIILEKMILFLH